MSLLVVHHATGEPALHGAAAAALCKAIGARLVHGPVGFDLARHADAFQHVTRCGQLVASGLLWAERLGLDLSARSTADETVAAALAGDVVLAHRPGDPQSEDHLSEVTGLAGRAGVDMRHFAVRVPGEGADLAVVGEASGAVLATVTRDRYGRVDMPLADVSPKTGAVRIALVGSEHDQREAYPANIAALADAADALGLDLTLVFLDPKLQSADDFAQAAREVGGVLLPGGSDMGNVTGQILAAGAGLDAGLPTLGLCLGMQSMSTAVARRTPGFEAANLEEADPDAPIKTFVPMAGTPGLPVYRLGEATIRAQPGTRIAALLGAAPTVLCNHRYRLAPGLVGPLDGSGLAVGATDATGGIVDAVEHRDHPFYTGMQGHPELSSRRDAPHPLITAFVAAAAGRAS
ncbi:glutamine amidotransferase-related protein [Methylobrevis pamukkalensis]|uniref:CTP synthase (glutamine hydrolyzing) n=1 Tax=Methylobrevis pamukkalensis TaxID=1439726 RepID=A0A1E3H4G9_9HYPH|nr:gamma-glutamyl-gamma-aminobutyrate hydrolase family protein [Methylobrevis pamukkalensis]ODN71223.1 CTP synthase [Methylobrevis pamukkalensis]